jgi:formate dehydrogenase major subunit
VNNERWQTDSFFRDYLVHYTNAATIINPEFRDTEQLDGVFSGLQPYADKIKEWPFNGFLGQYTNKSTRS